MLGWAAFSCAAALMPATSYAFGNDDHWVSGWGQGISEAIITKGPGNQIYVTCDDSAGREATGISFMLGGKSATGSSILLGFDKDDPKEFSLWDGVIPSNCRACASVYDVVIAGFKKHSSVYVRFENGDATRFSLKGARKAIGQCVADFYR